jgi:hypothetical protein
MSIHIIFPVVCHTATTQTQKARIGYVFDDVASTIHESLPCGTLPFRGLGSYVAPLCYLYPHPADVYPVFRELYVRHFCRLHVISDETSPSPALPALCRAFEDMIQHAEPEVCFHLLQIGVPALRLAAGASTRLLCSSALQLNLSCVSH